MQLVAPEAQHDEERNITLVCSRLAEPASPTCGILASRFPLRWLALFTVKSGQPKMRLRGERSLLLDLYHVQPRLFS